MIIIAGTITIPADKRAGCIAAIAPFQKATRTQPGCLAYVFSADPVRDDVISVYEQWADAPSLEAHFRVHPNYTAMRELFAQHGITGVEVRKYRTDADAPVYNAQRVATASFDE